MRYNILLLGSGGREHALAWKIARSPLLGEFYVIPGNPGIWELAKGIDGKPSDFELVRRTVVEKDIDMVVCGPEDPLVEGLRDYLASSPEVGKDLLFVGPGKDGARLEGSKDFAKGFMSRHGIPTAAYRTFRSGQKEQAVSFLRTLKPPYVIKADGLAAGKGVIISPSLDEAVCALDSIFGGRFGKAGEKVVIEEFLNGVELSCFVLTDGRGGYLMLPSAKDYKRVFDADQGPNTGGMGSVSPVPFHEGEFARKVEEKIIAPTVRGLMEDGIDYRGFIFFGLIDCSGEPYVIEYNARMGDPETQSVMVRTDSDLVAHMAAAAAGDLSAERMVVSPNAAVTCIVVSGGYPDKYPKGLPITGLQDVRDVTVFHAGTALKDGTLVTSGGRVLALTALAPDLRQARDIVYSQVGKICFEGSFHRRDIASDMIRLQGNK